MKVIVTTNIKRTITLCRREALYLEELTRNYLGEGQESENDRHIREKLFLCATRNIEGPAEYGISSLEDL